jgi:hypothetical protein
MIRDALGASRLCVLALVLLVGQAQADPITLGLEPAAYEKWHAAQAAWDPAGFTDPAKHNPDQFKYIVHAGPNVLKGGGRPIPAFMNRIQSLDFNQMHWFSASLISDRNTSTFSMTGVVLQVPAEKILTATSDDMRSCLSGAADKDLGERMKRLLEMYALKGPDQILARSKGGTGFFHFDLSWTEVLVFGSNPAPKPIRITGLFAHKDSAGKIILEPSDLKVVRETAAKMQLPLVVLPPPKDFYVLKVRAKGTREPKEWGSFTSYGPKEVAFCASEPEVKAVFDQARAHGARVTLVPCPDGIPSYDADPDYFKGVWWTGEKLIQPADLPVGVGPATFTFGAEPES